MSEALPEVDAHEIERAARHGVAAALLEFAGPLLGQMETAALKAIFAAMDEGKYPEPHQAMAALCELHAIRRVWQRLEKQVRQSAPPKRA